MLVQRLHRDAGRIGEELGAPGVVGKGIAYRSGDGLPLEKEVWLRGHCRFVKTAVWMEVMLLRFHSERRSSCTLLRIDR